MANVVQRLAARAIGAITQDDFKAGLEAVAEALGSRNDVIADPAGFTLISSDGGVVVNADELRKVQERAQQAWQIDPLIKQAVRVKRVFALGAGVTFTAENPEVDQFLHADWRDPLEKMPEQLEDWCNTLLVTCELCLRFFEAPDGTVRVRQIPFQEIYDVVTDPDDRNRIVWIWRKYTHRVFNATTKTWTTEQKDELVKGEDVIWIATNRIPGTVRGFPDLYPAIQWARAYNEWLRDRMAINKSKGAWAWIRKVTGGAGQVLQAAAKLAADVGGKVKSALTDDDGEKRRAPPKPGSVINSNDKVTWEVVNAKVGADDAKEDGRALKLQVAAATNVFEHYFGDASVANLASAKAMELPMLRDGETLQWLLGRIVAQVFRRKLEGKVKAGRIGKSAGTPLGATYTITRERVKDGALVEEKIEKPVVDCQVDVNFPPLRTEEDREKRAKAGEIEQRMGIKSKATLASEAGVEDWEIEQARLFKERQEEEARGLEDETNKYPPFPGTKGAQQQPPPTDDEGGDD